MGCGCLGAAGVRLFCSWALFVSGSAWCCVSLWSCLLEVEGSGIYEGPWPFWFGGARCAIVCGRASVLCIMCWAGMRWVLTCCTCCIGRVCCFGVGSSPLP